MRSLAISLAVILPVTLAVVIYATWRSDPPARGPSKQTEALSSAANGKAEDKKAATSPGEASAKPIQSIRERFKGAFKPPPEKRFAAMTEGAKRAGVPLNEGMRWKKSAADFLKEIDEVSEGEGRAKAHDDAARILVAWRKELNECYAEGTLPVSQAYFDHYVRESIDLELNIPAQKLLRAQLQEDIGIFADAWKALAVEAKKIEEGQ